MHNFWVDSCVCVCVCVCTQLEKVMSREDFYCSIHFVSPVSQIKDIYIIIFQCLEKPEEPSVQVVFLYLPPLDIT